MTQQKPYTGLVYSIALAYCAAVTLLALLMDGPAQVWAGYLRILTTEDTLITDYVALGGVGAALFNSVTMILLTVAVLRTAHNPANGFTVAVLGLMGGFALFGKNLFNDLPILLGAWLNAKLRHEPFGQVSATGLLASCIGPVVSAIAFSGGPLQLAAGLLVGVLIGFTVPYLLPVTSRFINGLSLYGMGFPCALTAMLIVAVWTSLGGTPAPVLVWATGYNGFFAAFLGVLCALCILGGLFFLCGRSWRNYSPGEAWRDYRPLLRTSGRAPSDYLDEFGPGPTLINIGLVGLVGTAYILLIGGDLNGATVGAVLVIMGYGAYGKHPLNILPVMAGLVLSSFLMTWSLTDPSMQIAGLFCTTLAPVAGVYGWPAGVLAGFLHSCLVLKTGGPVSGLNLYNNGFSASLVVIFLSPVLNALRGKEKTD